MAKLKSVLSGTDMAGLTFKASSAMKAAGRSCSGARILPCFGDLMPPLPPEKKIDDLLLEEKQEEMELRVNRTAMQ